MSLVRTPHLFAILSALVEERAGLHYPVGDAAIFLDKVSARAVEAGFDSLLDYYYYLRYDDETGEELASLIDALVVNETYFFREYEQLRVMVDQFIEPAVAERGGARVWSAACATGEEPLTIAMLLADRGLLARTELVATDISRRALEQARSGSYGPRSLRQVPAPHLAQRFLTREDGRVRCARELVDAVSWRHLNLLDVERIAALGTFDAILCRNVLIYFRDELSQRIVANLSSSLRPGGGLFVGVSESLLRFGSALDCQERGGVFVYTRSGA